MAGPRAPPRFQGRGIPLSQKKWSRGSEKMVTWSRKNGHHFFRVLDIYIDSPNPDFRRPAPFPYEICLANPVCDIYIKKMRYIHQKSAIYTSKGRNRLFRRPSSIFFVDMHPNQGPWGWPGWTQRWVPAVPEAGWPAAVQLGSPVVVSIKLLGRRGRFYFMSRLWQFAHFG